MDKNAKWTIAPAVRATHSEDGAVLLDISKGRCYSLNAVAAHIWVVVETSQVGIALDGIVSALEPNFKVSRHVLESDTAECLEMLHRMGLVQRNGHVEESKAHGAGG